MFLKKISPIAFCFSFLLFVILGWIWHGNSADYSFYLDFFRAYPILYQKYEGSFYGVVYLPYFYLIFCPFTLISSQTYFWAINGISFFMGLWGYSFIWKIDSKVGKIYSILLPLFCPVIAEFGNIELIVAIPLFYLWLHIKIDGGLFNWWHPILVSFLGFKIISFIIVLLILLEIKQGFWKYLLIIILTQAFLNLPFILINPNLISFDFLWDVFTHPPKFILGNGVLMLFARFSFSIPLIVIFWKLSEFLVKKRKSAKNVNYRWRTERKEID